MSLREGVAPRPGIIEPGLTRSRARSCVIDHRTGKRPRFWASCPKLDRYMRVYPVRLVACLAICLIPVLATAAETDAQAPSDPQAYCVNRSADFYPYVGEPCKSGYQLGPGNCRKADGRMMAVPREQCAAMGGLVALPFEGGRPLDGPQPLKPIK
jgi:hypothetical protein